MDTKPQIRQTSVSGVTCTTKQLVLIVPGQTVLQ